MRPVAWLSCLLVLAGCASPGSDTAGAPDPADALVFGPGTALPIECSFNCYEPTIAADPEGRIFVADGLTSDLAVSLDAGRTWNATTAPPFLRTPNSYQGDVLLQVAPSGRLYYSALIFQALPGRPLLESIQVAWSDDGAQTWAGNVMINPAQAPGAAVLYPDRQWLGFGAGETMYLTYNQIPSGIWIAKSDDAGATWGGWTRAVAMESRGDPSDTPSSGPPLGQSGPPIVLESGRVALTACLRGPAGVGVFLSDDEGATFKRVLAGGPACTWFPVLAHAGGERLMLAYTDGTDLHATKSDDGGATWSAPALWGASGWSSPWPLPRADGALEVAFFDDAPNGTRLALARGAPTAAPTLVAHVEAFDGREDPPTATDFAHLARLEDGRLAIVWSDADGTISIAFSGA